MILRTRAGLVGPVATGQRVQLLSEVALERRRGHAGRGDSGEAEQVGDLQLVAGDRAAWTDADVDGQRLERAAGHPGLGAKAHTALGGADVGGADSLDGELEEVAEVGRNGGDECFSRRLESRGEVEVDVAGCPRASRQAQLEGKPPLSTQPSGAAWRRRASSRVKATTLRERPAGGPPARAAALSRASSAARNAAGVA